MIGDFSWTIKSGKKSTGRDQLGMEAVGISMEEELARGITSITAHARYYALYCWILMDFWETERPDYSLKAFKTHMHRHEAAFIIACNSHDHIRPKPTIAGVDAAAKIWASKQDPIDLDFYYLAANFGNYGYAYRSQMKNLRLITDPENSRTPERLVDPLGVALANAYKQVIEPTSYFTRYRESKLVPRSALEELGTRACLCLSAEKSALDRTPLRDTLLYRWEASTTPLARCATLALILDVIKKMPGLEMSRKTWRCIMYYGSITGNLVYEPSEALTPIASLWQVYQLREYFTYALEAMFSLFTRELEDAHRMSLEFFIKGLMQDIDIEREMMALGLKVKTSKPSNISVYEFLISIEGAINESEKVLDPTGTYFHIKGFENEASEENLVTKLTQSSNANKHSYYIYAVVLLLTLFVRWRKRIQLYDVAWQLFDRGGESRLSIENTFLHLDRFIHKKLTLQELTKWIYCDLLIPQHYRVATDKLAYTGLDTFCFVYSDGSCRYLKQDSPSFNVFRILQAQTMLADIGLIKETTNKTMFEITPDGEKVLAELVASPESLFL